MEKELTDREARIAYDIGMHASDEALKTFSRILETAPTELSIAANIVANANLQWRLKATIEAFSTHADPQFKESIEKAQKAMEASEGPKFAAMAAAGAKKFGFSPRS
jgi:hypothetical protein